MVHATLPGAIDGVGAGAAADRRDRRWRRVGQTAAGSLLAALLFVCYLHVSRTQRVESDGASNALQAWAMLHGNLLLHGWIVPDVSFYLTELPEYMLVEAVRGLNADVLHVAAALTYTLAVVLAALLARGMATGREAAVRMLVAAGIMLAPEPGPGVFILLFQPDHFGTQVPMLATWLILDRVWHGSRRWWAPVLIGILLSWIGISDQIASLIGVIPLVLVCGLRAWQRIAAGARARSAWFELSLAAAGLVSVAAARVTVKLISLSGGYRMLPLTAGAITLRELPGHLRLWLQGVTGFYGASFTVRPGLPWAFAALHLAGLALAAWGLWLAIRRFHRNDDVVSQLLAIAIVVVSLAFIASSRPSTYWGTRDLAGLLAMGAVLAGRMAGPRLAAGRSWGRVTLGLFLTGYLVALGWAATRPPVPADTQDLANWLIAQRAADGLTRYGLSSYGLGNVTTMSAGGTVGLRSVVATRRGISPGAHEFDLTWYNPSRQDMNFAVVRIVRGDDDPVSRAELSKAFGPPTRYYRYGPYLIMTWHKNLLTQLGPAAPH